jgi:hypothetical protein
VVSEFPLQLYRASLHAYPPAFRREYGPVLLQSLLDQQRVEGTPLWRVAVREIADVAATAPRMRGESPMARVVVTVGTLTLCVVAAVAIGPLAVPAVVGAAALLWFGSVRSAPTAEGAARGGSSSGWLLGGLAALAGAIAIPLIDGGELNQIWWSVMAVLGLAGVALLITAVLLKVSSQGVPRAVS